jgi:hypothetical protein
VSISRKKAARSAAHLLTRDEARRIPAKIGKLPGSRKERVGVK